MGENMFAKQYYILIDIAERNGWTDEKKQGAVEILNRLPIETQESVLTEILKN